MSMNRIVVGAHYGLKDWLAQRITAVYMTVYVLVMGSALLLGVGKGYDAWQGLMSCSLVRMATLLFVLALAWHAWVGVRDIWMDYVKPTALRLTLHVLTLTYLIACVVWAVQILGRL